RGTADQAVGRLQGDGAHHVVADVLRDLEVEVALVAADLDLGGEQVVLLGHAVDGELHVDDRADDARDAADAADGVGLAPLADRCSHGLSLAHLLSASALARATISLMSLLI